MKSDLEIQESIKPKKINTIANKYGISKKYLKNYGEYIAKVDERIINDLPNKNGKLILVTSINPTPYGEGKTTQAIGLCDALNKIGKKAIVTLREPSMGPVFGKKGGATGGGYAQVMPMDDINLHFTGDIHAITSANNLLCAIIDNHIYQGNELKIKDIIINRCLDINDRELRSIKLKNRDESFCISVATELMAILCLSKSFKDLRTRIDNMIVAFDINGKPITPKDLKATDSILILLKDAINPNIVQTLEHNLAIVHGGPFANIAHGTCSIIGTNLALRISDYVITEAGFGSDLGCEKYFDIVTPISNNNVDLVVINVSTRSINYQGIDNLKAHIEIVKKFSSNILVCINKFKDDNKKEIEEIVNYVSNLGVETVISDVFLKGSKGGLDFARKVIELTSKTNQVNRLYDNNMSIKNKIDIICKKVYNAKEVKYSEEALKNIKRIEKLKLDKLPICISKTPASLSDDSSVRGYPCNYDFHIRDVYLNNGAGFISVISGSVLRLPGLAKDSAYQKMTIDNNKKIGGIS